MTDDRAHIATTCDRIAQRMGGRFVLNEDRPMTDKPEAVRMMLVPEHPTYEQLAKMSDPWCCTVEEMAESWAELLDNIEATPSQPDASALVEAAKALASDVQDLIDCRGGCGEWGAECPLQDAGKPGSTMDRLQRLLDALTAWEAQHG